jgi:hypothetical protein
VSLRPAIEVNQEKSAFGALSAVESWVIEYNEPFFLASIMAQSGGDMVTTGREKHTENDSLSKIPHVTELSTGLQMMHLFWEAQ